MVKPKIKVGHYYKLSLTEDREVTFAVLYGFERGKNKDVYTLMMYTDKKNVEFPIQKNLFDTWVEEGRITEITSDEALTHAL